MKTDNELIAEFMGIVFWKEIQGQKYYKVPKEHVYVNNANLGQFRYDKSWDWLMPVVNNIWQVAVDDNSKTHVAGMAIKMIGEQVSVFSSIDEVYKAVVNFIKWYNNQ